MSLTNRVVYGFHSFTAINRSTGLPYGTAKIVESGNFSTSRDQSKLFGGSNPYPWAVEDVTSEAEISFKAKQVEDWMFEVFHGKAPTTVTTPATGGAVSAVANKYGTSAVAATGIASVSVKTGSEADLKFTKYVIKVASATTLRVYAMSDVDFNRGTDKSFVDNTMEITSAALTLVMGADVDIPGFGLKITGGASAIGMTTGHTATFEVHPPFDKKTEVSIGAAADVFPEFAAHMVAQKRSNGEMFEIEAFKCKGSGLPLGMQEKEFMMPEMKCVAFWDDVLDLVAKIRMTTPTSGAS